MKINSIGLPKTQDIAKITQAIATSMNKYLSKEDNTPLTTKTLDELQAKFWPAKDYHFADGLWKIVRDTVNNTIDTLPSKKKPVVLTTEEGLDVVIALEEQDGELVGTSLDVSAGGPSINVARALNNFGTQAELIGIVGNGTRGHVITRCLEKEGVNTKNLLRINNDSKMHISTVANKNEYWLISQRPGITQEELTTLSEMALEAAKRNEKKPFVTGVYGPNGSSQHYLAEIIEKAQNDHGVFAIYDTKTPVVSREQVFGILNARTSMIKPNLKEFSEIVDYDEEKLRSDKDLIAHFAQALINHYDTKMMIVSLGADGALLIDKKRVAYAKPPKIKVESPGCAGDTAIGALIDRAEKQKYNYLKLTDSQFKKLLSAYVAGGAGTAEKPGSNLATLEDLQRLEKEVKVKFI